MFVAALAITLATVPVESVLTLPLAALAAVLLAPLAAVDEF